MVLKCHFQKKYYFSTTMKTLAVVSEVLVERATQRRYGKMQLAADAGITYRTLSHVLSGEHDFKVSTLMAVADRLGLELVLVPKEARAMFPPDLERGRQTGIVSKVQARLARVRKKGA